MEILHKDDGERGRFYISKDGTTEGEMTYRWADAHTIIIDHTQVAPHMEGKGIGKQLVEKAVTFARDKGIKINSQCAYASHVLNRNDAYKDVMAS